MKKIFTILFAFVALSVSAQQYYNGQWYSMLSNQEYTISVSGLWGDETQEQEFNVFPPTESTMTYQWKNRKYFVGNNYGSLDLDFYESTNGSTYGSGTTVVECGVRTDKTSFQNDSYAVQNPTNLHKFKFSMHTSYGCTVANLRLPMKHHILFENGTVNGKATWEDNAFGELAIDEVSEPYMVNFRSFYTTGDLTISSSNPEVFRVVSADNTADVVYAVGANACATKTGNGTAGGSQLGNVANYNFGVYFCPKAEEAYEGTITISDGTTTCTFNVSGTGLKVNQTINWDAAASYNYGEAIPVAVATSGLDVDYEISDASVLKFENGAFVALHGGEVTVTAKQAGNYKYNAAADVVKTITIVPPTTYGNFEQFTCDEAVEFFNQTYEESFADDVTVGENYLGGDSIVHVNIVINHATFGTDEMTIVYGDEVEWNGIALKDSTVGAHSVVAVLTNAAGCDSTVTLTLTVNKIETLEVPVDLAFCAGGSEWYRGTEYAEAGVYDVPVEGATRDTLYKVNVTVLQPSFVEEDMTIIVGTDTAWNGIALKDSTVGVHYVEFVTTNVAGCDSTVTLTLTVNKLEMLETEYQIEICEGSEQEYRGVTYNEEGMFTLDVIEGETRDTLLTVVVTVNAKGYEEILLTDTIGNTIEIPEGEWTLGDDIVSGSYQIQETDIEGLVFVQIGETEKGCEAVTKIIVTVEEKPQDQGDPTGFENVGEAQKAVKEFRNGVLYIRRGEKMYTASGELVK